MMGFPDESQSVTEAMLPKITPEFPNEAQLTAYGDFAFLYLRSDHHRDFPLHIARRMIQPPIDLGFFKTFRFDGVPRFGITWAMLSPVAEEKFIAGEMLEPREWRSGGQMWVMEIIAPYGQRCAVQAVNWLRKSVPEPVKTVRYMRMDPDHKAHKIIEISRGAGAIRGAVRLPFVNKTED